MDDLINARYIADLKSSGRQDVKLLSIVGKPGDSIFINGSPKRCEAHFEVLCGLRKPDIGDVKICGRNLYEMAAQESADFRRDNIGAIPLDGGLIPELPMIDQVTLPMKLMGLDEETVLTEVRRLTSNLMPLHSLYNLPGKCNARKRSLSAILRAVICKPKLIIINGFLDDFPEIDTDALWRALLATRPKDSVLIYLSGAPAPEQVEWTQQLRV